ncbi:MAG: hypothetical protein O2797_02625 [Bacteroidetes bacterium]|nr:hypothetical protein [Bacteroidota bacterium]MDA1333095.1 hypothetical protein [Bacteroidota bacterium]
MKHTTNQSHHRDPQFEASDALVSSLRELVEHERAVSMMTMPTERVMRAVKLAQAGGNRIESWLESELLSWFKPVFVAGAIVILGLAAFNFELSQQNDFNQSTTEMVLGLQPVTVASAYDLSFEDH